MTSGLKIDAAAVAQQAENELKNEIAQGGPKLSELAVNIGSAPGSLVALFEMAASALEETDHAKKLEVFFEQQQQRAVQREQEKQKEQKAEQEAAWLASMSPEYKAAYGHFMDTANKVDKDYDDMLHQIDEHEQKIDDKTKDIDDRTIHISGNRRVYMNNNNMVDENGQPLDGQDLAEAKSAAQKMKGTPASYKEKQEEDDLARKRQKLENLKPEITAAQNEAKGLKKEIESGGIKNVPEVKKCDEHVVHKNEELHSKLNDAFGVEVSRSISPNSKEYNNKAHIEGQDYLNSSWDNDKSSDPAQKNLESSKAKLPSVSAGNTAEDVKNVRAKISGLDDSWGNTNDNADHKTFATKVDGNAIAAPSLTPTFTNASSGSNVVATIDPANKPLSKPAITTISPI